MIGARRISQGIPGGEAVHCDTLDGSFDRMSKYKGALSEPCDKGTWILEKEAAMMVAIKGSSHKFSKSQEAYSV